LRDDLLARSGSFVCAVVRVQLSQRRNALAASSVFLSAEPVRTTSETNQRSPMVANKSTAMPEAVCLTSLLKSLQIGMPFLFGRFVRRAREIAAAALPWERPRFNQAIITHC
jgi:hypothetical protein